MTDLIRLARGCWISVDEAAELTARCTAALRLCASDTVISLTTAALLLEIWLPLVPDEIHLASAQPARAGRDMTRVQRPEFVAHRRQLGAADIAVARDLPVTSLARTWVDLGGSLGLPDMVAAGDSVLRLGASEQELADAIDRSRGRRGVRLARLALPLLDARSRSRPESHLRTAISEPDLPAFEVNEPVYRAGGRGWLAEPDLSLLEAKIALEYQGAHHDEDERRQKDITRAEDLRREGWLCIEYGPAQVFARPWQIAPEIRQLIRSRAPHLLRRRVLHRVA